MNAPLDQQFFARLSGANAQFDAVLPELLARLAGCATAFDPQQPDAALAADMQLQLHTMAGSAATFGMRVLGQRARALEQRLRVLMAFDTVGAADWASWVADLEVLVAWGKLNPRSHYYDGELVQ